MAAVTVVVAMVVEAETDMAARWLRHLFCDQATARRAFPREALQAIEQATTAGEARHSGQLRLVVEASLPLARVWRGVEARQRAVEHFGELGIWDTEANNGVLIYLLLADRQVEILADRGIHARVGEVAWQVICGHMERAFRQGDFRAGALQGINAISELLERHFPAQGGLNELPDRPLVL